MNINADLAVCFPIPTFVFFSGYLDAERHLQYEGYHILCCHLMQSLEILEVCLVRIVLPLSSQHEERKTFLRSCGAHLPNQAATSYKTIILTFSVVTTSDLVFCLYRVTQKNVNF